MKQNQRFTLLACILLCVTIAFSLAFIAIESNHDCSEYDCQICFEIESCKVLLRSISYIPVFLLFSSPLILHTLFLYRSAAFRNKAVTLITLKVKLSN